MCPLAWTASIFVLKACERSCSCSGDGYGLFSRLVSLWVYKRLPFEAAFLTWPFVPEKEVCPLAEAGVRYEPEKEWL